MEMEMETGTAGVDNYSESKGSLYLRADHMNYSRAVLNSKWHQAREAEPKDYDLSLSDVRDLSRSTYNRISTVTDGTLPKTTYTDMSEQIFTKKDYDEKEYGQKMLDPSSADHVNLDRETGLPKSGFGAVLPSHHPDHNKRYLVTTHQADFGPPYPFTPAPEKDPNEGIADHTLAYKKCLSQFTDTVNARRSGRNTWQDESGFYANSHLKAQAPVYEKTQTLPSWE